MRGRFSGGREEEWCERRLLIRIHLLHPRPQAQRDSSRAARTVHALPVPLAGGNGGADGSEESEAGSLALRSRKGSRFRPAPGSGTSCHCGSRATSRPTSTSFVLPAGLLINLVEASGSEMAPAAGPVRSTPIMLVSREALPHWQKRQAGADSDDGLTSRAQRILESLRAHGASFFSDLVCDTACCGPRSSRALANSSAAGG